MANKTLSGAEVIIECLKREGVDTIFGYPGGSAIPMFDAILDSNIKVVLTRHEQGATHMADGYARQTGKVGVALVTSGPGATNTFTGIYTALMDSSPIVVLAAQTTTPNLGKDAFQECDTSGMTFAAVKHSYLVKDSNDLPRIMKEAFHIARSGRPGPVLIDLPKDVTAGPCTAPFTDKMDLPGYKIPTHAPIQAVEKAAEFLKKSKKPLLLVGHGAMISGASRQVRELAEKLNAPVCCTMLGLGAFPTDHELSLGMLGMHGTHAANIAMQRCDLLIAVGVRFSDRALGDASRFAPNAKVLHIDITVGVDEFNYAVHAVEAMCALAETKPISVRYVGTARREGQSCETFFVEFEGGVTACYHCVAGNYVSFNVIVLTTVDSHCFTIDNDALYKALLDQICNRLEGKPHCLAGIEDLTDSIKVLLAGKCSRESAGAAVGIDSPALETVRFDGDAFEKEYAANARPIYL